MRKVLGWIGRSLAALLLLVALGLAAGLGYRRQSEVAVQRRWAARFENDGNLILALLRAVAVAPRHTLGDALACIRGLLVSQSQFVGENLQGALMTTNLGEQSTRFALPMFVIDGAEDNITPAVLAREYLDSVTAPRKDFTAIAGAGHLVPITHPEDFRRSLQEHVRPLLAGTN